MPTRPYGDERLYLRKDITFNTGLTVLTGCNGSGKSTLLLLIKDKIRKMDSDDILCLKYDDRKDGGSHMMESMLFHDNLSGLANMAFSSEGERIMSGFGNFVSSLGCKVSQTNAKEVWILVDAVGSGLSIDGILEIKDFANFIQEENPRKNIYFVVSTNEYEFARGSDCIDVTTFRHITFNDYEVYKSYILETKKKKSKRRSKT